MFEYKARVVRVVDADTLDVIIDLGFNVLTNQRVRLLGINAAEKNTEMGKKAIDYVRFLLPLGTTVILQSEKDKKEKFGRYLARVFFPESKECLNDVLVTKGLAVLYDGQSPKELHVPLPTIPEV
jgi:micrococcal nuclease